MALKDIEPLEVEPGDEVCYIPIFPKNGSGEGPLEGLGEA
jgi:hypothetical protein